MKKISFLIILCLSLSISQAQNLTDGLRYATDNTNGSARFSSMSGAFGALGGDLSALNVNPAGSAVFLTSTAAVSLSLLDKNNETDYFNTSLSNNHTNVNINQAGIVFVFDNYNEKNTWNKFTIGLNYDITNNFNDAFNTQGQSNTSIDRYFLNYAQGIPLNLLQLQPGETVSDLYSFIGETSGFVAQQAFLGYQSFILEAENQNPGNSTYFSNIAPGLFNQEYSHNTSGYNSKYSLNLATQVNDKLYFGLNLNSHIIEYRQSTYFFESNNNSGSIVNRVGFSNNLAVLGSGFSAQFGVIGKATDNLRLGLSYDTPTWYVISEETSQRIDTRRFENDEDIATTVRPNIINIYDDYDLRTPGKVTGSIAYIFGPMGLLSLDYSYRDFSGIQFKPVNDPVFLNANSNISNQLKGTSTVRIGGEYRMDQASFRGGLRYEQSPFEDTEIMGDLMGFSMGVGYDFGSFRLDAAYARAQQERNQQLFQGAAFTNSAKINTADNFVTLTAVFQL